ncbi:chemotaxis protein CheW [Proteinivorax hydrogeniformans]|uniref:Chemotaxis protein CheW n=1 Tax=Proteinivorax hydrogeniformans TaxID=1826727 RepID=A0AAU8HQY8_9FIRM
MSTQEQKFVIFQLGEESYGIDILNVQGIERMLEITRVPKTSDFVEGVCNLRGSIVPVIDLRKRFGLDEKEKTDNTRIIVVSIEEVEVGLIVDAANDVISIDSDSIEPAPSVIGSIDNRFINGVGKLENKLIILLDLQEILKKEEIVKLQEITD